jgi:excisionase family DNA binding protein
MTHPTHLPNKPLLRIDEVAGYVDLPNKNLFTPTEVAKYFFVTRKTVYEWVKNKDLTAFKVRRAIRITRESILKHNQELLRKD